MVETEWYKDSGCGIDYSRAIMATDKCGDHESYILLPVPVVGDFETAGYDWFSLSKGSWNSCRRWREPREAVRFYEESGYTITNANITTEATNGII